jgi:hypothetical protein
MDMLDDPIIVESDGTRPIVVKRIDIPNADDPRAKRLGVAANRIGQLNLEWEPDVLAELAKDVDVSGLFFPDELAELSMPSLPEAGADEPVTIDDTKPTRCQPGDVWHIGRHAIACVDSTDRATVERLIAGRKVGMVWSDAPYAIGAVDEETGQTGGLGRPGGGYPFGGAKNDGKSKPIKSAVYAPVIGDDSAETARASATLLLELYPDALHIWWGANHFSDVFPPSPCWIVWDKENTGNFADAELAWCSDDSAVRIFRHMWNGMVRASEHGKRVHPTQKPIALCEWAFTKYGSIGDLIFDPFLGSGPSVKAAERTGLTVVGCELSPHYIDHLIEWGEAEGLTVERAESIAIPSK